MSITSFTGGTSKIKALVGIRARLILFALILIVPMMFDRVRLLEESRQQQVKIASNELAELARHTADAQREIILTVQAVLKSSAFIYGSARSPDRACTILRASMRSDLPWIRSISVVGDSGTVSCSTSDHIVGLDLADRNYIIRARSANSFVVSDYIFSRAANLPTIMAALPAANSITGEHSVMIAAIDLKWISELMRRRTERAGLSALLVGNDGVVLAASRPQDASLIGKPLQEKKLLTAVTNHEIDTAKDSGSLLFQSEHGKQEITFARVDGTQARMIVSINETELLGDIDRSIRTAYMQLGLLVLFALLGGWLAGERLIIRPISIITSLADRFGQGDLSSPESDMRLPPEFQPLARSFGRMAMQLRERERELVATNDRLQVMASVDMISGLANRRGLQNRLEFEWRKAEQTGGPVSLIMIDVDHFKLFNDTYGHLEGDKCLRQIGEALAAIAGEVTGFAARYGGEEFCLLLPKTNGIAAMEIGERVRAAVEALNIPHSMSAFQQVTVSAGMAAVAPGQAASVQDLIEAADAALYVAKHRGRNNVVAHALIRSDEKPLSLAS
ncbi:Bacteriophytochrome cph2 [Afipia felis]|uniref:diguanylate cyclase n=1 Tax=Afipia felis TaxID=1035 RepID=A0A090MUP7_AFIFE|nr:diguanylate cyclase [Afipia felis]MBE0701738.1 diguanylate cyclase [Afipia sp.]RTL75527.1 MAG: diguanylate cyclase [Bradyrhizobiaceae bacterium]CEG10087.1 Bacteriophytochrome cph2 [Afipia felis]